MPNRILSPVGDHCGARTLRVCLLIDRRRPCSMPGVATCSVDAERVLPSGRPVMTNLSPAALNDGRIPVSVSSYCGFRLNVFSHVGRRRRLPAVKHDARAIGRPRRRADVARRSASCRSCSRCRRSASVLADVADVARRQERRVELHAGTGRDSRSPRRSRHQSTRGACRCRAHRSRASGAAPVSSVCFGVHAVREHAAAVGGKLRAAAEVAVLGDTLQPGAVRMNDVDVGELQVLPAAVRHRHRAAAVRRERDPLAVRRPRRPEIAARAPVRQRLRPPRLQIHRPQMRACRRCAY